MTEWFDALDDGVVLIDPEYGRLSCGTSGPGRMAEPETIFNAIAERLKTTAGNA